MSDLIEKVKVVTLRLTWTRSHNVVNQRKVSDPIVTHGQQVNEEGERDKKHDTGQNHWSNVLDKLLLLAKFTLGLFKKEELNLRHFSGIGFVMSSIRLVVAVALFFSEVFELHLKKGWVIDKSSKIR